MSLRPTPEVMDAIRRVQRRAGTLPDEAPEFRWMTHSADPREIHRIFGADTPVALLDEPDRLTPELRAQGLLSPQDYAVVQRLRSAEFFLVRNDGSHGERLRCGRCGRKHAYFTWFCCEQPFRGLRDALYAFTKVRHADARARRILELIPDLGAAHPETARGLTREVGEDVLGIAVGLAEPITAVTARRFASIIQGRDRTFRL